MYRQTNNFYSLALQIYAAIIFIGFSTNASSQGAYASDTDLKAAYCLPYVNEMEQQLKKINGISITENYEIQRNNIREAGNVFNNKLRIYLQARNQSHNSEARLEVAAAMKAGEQSLAVFNKIQNYCQSQLSSKNLFNQAAEQFELCRKENGTEMLRLEICNGLSFLPY
jgi:hypothetical protein